MADSQFFMLPKELWGNVLPRFVPLGDLGRLFRSCKALSTFLTNDDFWRFVGALRFHMGDAEAGQLLKGANFNWRDEVIGRQKMSARVLFNPLTSSPAQFVKYVTFGEALSYDGAFMLPSVEYFEEGSQESSPAGAAARDNITIVQTKYPLQPLPWGRGNVAYFEVTLLVAHPDRGSSIGVAPKGLREAMPGWYPYTFGFHSDDGNLYVGHTISKKITGGPWQVGDTAGIGIDLDTHELFVTYNGKLVRSIKLEARCIGFMFPTIGIFRQEKIVVNLGSAPFAFDVIAYQKSSLSENPEKRRWRNYISRIANAEGNRVFFSKQEMAQDPYTAYYYGFDLVDREKNKEDFDYHSLDLNLAVVRNELIVIMDESIPTENILEEIERFHNDVLAADYKVADFDNLIRQNPGEARRLLAFSAIDYATWLSMHKIEHYIDITKTKPRPRYVEALNHQLNLKSIAILADNHIPHDHPILTRHMDITQNMTAQQFGGVRSLLEPSLAFGVLNNMIVSQFEEEDPGARRYQLLWRATWMSYPIFEKYWNTEHEREFTEMKPNKKVDDTPIPRLNDLCMVCMLDILEDTERFASDDPETIFVMLRAYIVSGYEKDCYIEGLNVDLDVQRLVTLDYVRKELAWGIKYWRDNRDGDVRKDWITSVTKLREEALKSDEGDDDDARLDELANGARFAMLAHPPQPGTSRRIQLANILERMIALYDELADKNYSKIEDYEYEIGDVMSVEPEEQNTPVSSAWLYVALAAGLSVGAAAGVGLFYWYATRGTTPSKK